MVPWMLIECASSASEYEPCAESTTAGSMMIVSATSAQTFEFPLETLAQLKPARVEVPESVSTETLVDRSSRVSVGVAHADTWNCGVTDAIDAQMGSIGGAASVKLSVEASGALTLPSGGYPQPSTS